LSVSPSPPRWPAPVVTPPCRRSPALPLRASDAAEPLLPPSSLSPLNPPSNRALTGLHGLNHHSPPPLLRPLPLVPSPGPIKATRRPPEHPTPHRALLFSSPAPETLPTKFPCPLRATTIARSPRCRPSSGEARAELPMLLSLFWAPAGELWCTGTTGGRTPVSAPPRSGTLGLHHHQSTVDQARSAGSPHVDPIHAFTRWKIIR
jgi:hypothetical protein